MPTGAELVVWTHGDDTLDACLTNSASAVHARRMSDKQSAALQRRAHPRGVGDGVEFGMTEPEVFFRARRTSLIFVGCTTTRRTVIAERTNFIRSAQNDRANLRALVFAEL